MKRQRTIYFNDARHYYLFVFEPPMALEDAWIPIDECAGTSVDTFIYGVARGDGLFYPSQGGAALPSTTREGSIPRRLTACGTTCRASSTEASTR